MKFNDHEWIAATPWQTWYTLITPALLQKCLHDCERVERVSETEYHIRFNTSDTQGFKHFDGTVFIEEAQAPTLLRLAFNGSGRHATLTIGHAEIRIEAGEHGGTRISYSLEAATGGPLARVKPETMEKRARRHLDGFFLRLSSLAADAPGAAPPPPPPPSTGGAKGLLSWLGLTAVVLVVLAYFIFLRP